MGISVTKLSQTRCCYDIMTSAEMCVRDVTSIFNFQEWKYLHVYKGSMGLHTVSNSL